MAFKASEGDRLITRKPHPCGSREWEVVKTGVDFKIKCLGCGHVVFIPRLKLEKAVKEIVPGGEAGLDKE